MQRVAMLSMHTSPLAQPGSRRRRRHERLRAGARVGARARRRRVRRLHARRAPRAAAGRRGRARLPGGARRGRAARAGPAARAARSSSARSSTKPTRRRSTRDAGRRAARELLAVGRGRPPAEARARPPDGRDVPHAGAGEGRRRRRRRPRRCGRASKPRSCACADLMLASTDDERDQLVRYYGAEPERIEVVPPGVDHTVFFPGDRAAVAQQRLGLDGRPVLLFVGRIQPLKGVDLAVRCLAELGDPTRDAARGRRSERPRRRRRARRACTRSPTSSALEHQRAFRRRRSRTTGSPTTTAPPTCASCRRAPSRSGSSRSKPPRAARRWSRPPSVGCARSSTTARPGFLVDERDPAAYAAPVDGSLERPELAARWARTRRRGRASTRGASPRRGCAVSTAISSRAARPLRLTARPSPTALDEASAPQHDADRRAPRRSGRARAVGADRRVRPARSALVRALRLRRARRGDDLLRSAPAHAALRGVLPARSARAPPEALYRFLLQRNHTTYGAHFSIGPDGDCYLVGRVLLEHLDVDELDRIIGVLYELVERWFQPVDRHRASAEA